METRDLLTLAFGLLAAFLCIFLILLFTPDNPVSGYRPRIELLLNDGATSVKFAVNQIEPVSFGGRVYHAWNPGKIQSEMGYLHNVTLMSEEAWKTFVGKYKKNPKICPGSFLSRNNISYFMFAGDDSLKRSVRGMAVRQGDQVEVEALKVNLLEATHNHGKTRLADTGSTEFFLVQRVKINGRLHSVSQRPQLKSG